MKILLSFLFLFSTTVFANFDAEEEADFSLLLPPENAEVVTGDEDFEVTSRNPTNDGCQIILGFQGHRRFDNHNNARNFCDNFHSFFNVRNRCFVVRNQEANWDYSFSFTGRGDNWGNARRNVHQQFIDYVFSRRFDRHRFDTNRRYPFSCGD